MEERSIKLERGWLIEALTDIERRAVDLSGALYEQRELPNKWGGFV